MRSAPTDLTARARIRDAALARFAADGVERTSVRAIAADAGVSAPLVLHHFGSKEGLRAAVDAHVVARYREMKRETMADGGRTDPAWILAALGESGPLVRYLARALSEATPEAAALYDEILEETLTVLALAEEQGYVRPSAHPRERAALLLTWGLAPLVLHEHLSRALGIDVLTTRGLARLARTQLEVYTHGLFTDERWAQAYAAIDEEDLP